MICDYCKKEISYEDGIHYRSDVIKVGPYNLHSHCSRIIDEEFWKIQDEARRKLITFIEEGRKEDETPTS
jgi:hypothetical protein